MQHERIGLGTLQNFLTGCWRGTSHSGKLRAMGSACVGARVGGLVRRGWRLGVQASRAGRTEPLLLRPGPAERPRWAQRRPYCPVLSDLAPSLVTGKASFSCTPCLDGDSV